MASTRTPADRYTMTEVDRIPARIRTAPKHAELRRALQVLRVGQVVTINVTEADLCALRRVVYAEGAKRGAKFTTRTNADDGKLCVLLRESETATQETQP